MDHVSIGSDPAIRPHRHRRALSKVRRSPVPGAVRGRQHRVMRVPRHRGGHPHRAGSGPRWRAGDPGRTPARGARARSWVPVFSKIALQWSCTVHGEMDRRSPIAVVSSPWATSVTTSRSRALSANDSSRSSAACASGVAWIATATRPPEPSGIDPQSVIQPAAVGTWSGSDRLTVAPAARVCAATMSTDAGTVRATRSVYRNRSSSSSVPGVWSSTPSDASSGTRPGARAPARRAASKRSVLRERADLAVGSSGHVASPDASRAAGLRPLVTRKTRAAAASSSCRVLRTRRGITAAAPDQNESAEMGPDGARSQDRIARPSLVARLRRSAWSRSTVRRFVRVSVTMTQLATAAGCQPLDATVSRDRSTLGVSVVTRQSGDQSDGQPKSAPSEADTRRPVCRDVRTTRAAAGPCAPRAASSKDPGPQPRPQPSTCRRRPLRQPTAS